MSETATAESQAKNPSEATSKKKYITTTPLLYEWQLQGLSAANDENMGELRFASVFESYVYALTGPRGGGKTESLALLAIIFMANGLPAWLNLPVKCYLKRNGAEKAELLESQPLDMDKLLNHTEEYQGGFLGIDEYQDWDNVMRSSTNQSLLLHSFIDQIRKYELSFGYTAKRLKDISGKTVSETDFEINCNDVSEYADSDDPNSPKHRGSIIEWNPVIDMSGYLTRRMGAYLMPSRKRMYLIWGSFNTKQRQDFFQAMRGVRLNLAKRVIGEGGPLDKSGELDFDNIKNRLNEVYHSGVPLLIASDIMRTLGLNIRQWSIVRQMLPEWGIQTKISNGQRIYYPE